MVHQIVVFHLEKQLYGVDITEVNEIVHMQSITTIPRSLPHVEGITNLRGNVCTVINGRILLGQSKNDRTSEEKIIVLDGGKIGVIVDQVSEILTVEETDKKSLGGIEALESISYIDYLIESNKQIITVLKLKEMVVPKTESKEEELVAI